ncbi:hypothetical protein POBR111598_10065 [Polynucleobacter brandtiae]
MLADDDVTLDKAPLIVTAEELPNLIAPSLTIPLFPPEPLIVIGPFFERIYAVPPAPLMKSGLPDAAEFIPESKIPPPVDAVD